jgi:hypothetical protein
VSIFEHFPSPCACYMSRRAHPPERKRKFNGPVFLKSVTFSLLKIVGFWRFNVLKLFSSQEHNLHIFLCLYGNWNVLLFCEFILAIMMICMKPNILFFLLHSIVC